MAGGEPITVRGHTFTAKPASRWRRLLKNYLPYWQASNPKFIITITKEDEPSTQKRTVYLFTLFSEENYKKEEIQIPSLEVGKSVDIKTEGMFLGYTGDTSLAVPIDLAETYPLNYQTIYSFHTTPKTWIFLALVAGLLAGAFAFLGNWLVTILDP